MRKTISTALALALVGTALAAAPSAGHTAKPGQPGEGECQVQVMNWPEEADDGTVIDIEVVPGLGMVYYCSYRVPDDTWGMPRRAVVWYGAEAQPVQVGPVGTAHDIGLELTPSGKINGTSTLADGRERAWVQDLRTGKVTWVDTGEAADHYVRRINDRGEVAGTIYGEGFAANSHRFAPGGLLAAVAAVGLNWFFNGAKPATDEELREAAAAADAH